MFTTEKCLQMTYGSYEEQDHRNDIVVILLQKQQLLTTCHSKVALICPWDIFFDDLPFLN